MSRVAVFQTLARYPGLNELGIDGSRIFPNYSAEERPCPEGPFIILRWGIQATTYWQTTKGPVFLTLWVHMPVEITNDFSVLDNILDRCDAALKAMWDVKGADGYTVTCVRTMGRSEDLKDDGFQTYMKNAGYEVLARNTV